jgi:hypothetical protein
MIYIECIRKLGKPMFTESLVFVYWLFVNTFICRQCQSLDQLRERMREIKTEEL